MADEILYSVHGSVALLRLNTPPVNLQTLSSMRLLDALIDRADRDRAVRALVLSGEGGRVFSAGSDIKEFPHLRGNFVEEKLRFENQVFDRLSQLRVPTVAALTGSALGGGLELALCCDFRILAEDAFLCTPEIQLGNFPGSGGPYRLVHCVGPAFAAEMMCTGRKVWAEEALTHGLVNTIAPAQEVTALALEWAERLAAKDPEWIEAVKELLHASACETRAEAETHARKRFLELIGRNYVTADQMGKGTSL